MKIRLSAILTGIYITLFLILQTSLNFVPIVLFFLVLILDIATKLSSGLKNLLYILAALSAFPNFLWLFIIFLPYAVFGSFLRDKYFVKSYAIGFALSFVPAAVIYLMSTYMPITLNFWIVLFVYLLLPVSAFFILKKKSLGSFELSDKDVILFFIILISTTYIAVNIVDDQSLFMSNGTRVYSRLRYATENLIDKGIIPIYNPRVGQGEATFLFDAPIRAAQYLVESYFMGFFNPLLFFNTHSFFILFISVLSLAVLFNSAIGHTESVYKTLAVAFISASIGLNFLFLQLLESLKQFTAFPIAYLAISIILDNPRRLNEFLVLMYMLAIIIPIHSAYGLGTIFFSTALLIIKKRYYLKDSTELKNFFLWLKNNKLNLAAIVLVGIFMPLFYLSSGVIYKDFLIAQSYPKDSFDFIKFKSGITTYFKDFFQDDMSFLSLSYPDISRIDDRNVGPFLSIMGLFAFIILLFLYKVKPIENFRTYLFSYSIYLILMALMANHSITFGGLFRTNQPLAFILIGLSILFFVCLFENNIAKLILIFLLAVSFIHMAPYAKDNIKNIHGEMIMSEQVMPEELDFIRQLPIDGRIMDYGLFNNAIDFGFSQLTGRYFSREEREELLYHIKNIYFKVHGPHSFGMEEFVLNKTGIEFYNYLRLGGYKYVFANICHPMGNFITRNIYPDYSSPIYQNDCMVIFVINNTNYAEKIDIVKEVDEDTYRKIGGYRHDAIRPGYSYESSIIFPEYPKEPQGLEFERVAPTKVIIYGNFDDGEWIIFKERFWPRWKASMGESQVRIYPDNFEQMLIRTAKGDSITLDYSVLPIEKVFGIISFIGILGFGLILLLALRKNRT